MTERIAIVAGVRTPMCKAGGRFADIQADDLGAKVVSELISTTAFDPGLIDQVIIGNVAQPAHAANIARVVALKAGLPNPIPAFTVHRNCASGAESLTTAADKILAGQCDVVIVGGTESMSNIPLLVSRPLTKMLAGLNRAKTTGAKLRELLRFRPSFLTPVIGIVQGLTDPISGMIMGSTAEVLAREFKITRDEQDAYALMSHERAAKAIASGVFEDEIVPVPIPPQYDDIQDIDDAPRANQSMSQLERLKPYFDRRNGTVTVGNSCPLTDGAAALLVMREKRALELGMQPLGFLSAYAYAGLEPERMGLGPAYATAKLLSTAKHTLADIDLIELNEAFAAQVIANERAFASKSFAAEHLRGENCLGEIDRDKLNVNGGAIALGHPVGMTGTRLVLTLLHELRRRNKTVGLATMCIGGGQGGALLVEAA